MGVGQWIFGRYAREIRFYIVAHPLGSILLNQKRCGRMPAENRQQPYGDRLSSRPLGDAVGNLDQPLPLGLDCQLSRYLLHIRPDLHRLATSVPYDAIMSAPEASA